MVYTRLGPFTADGLDDVVDSIIPSEDMIRPIVEQAGTVPILYSIYDLDYYRTRQVTVPFSRDNVPGSYQKLHAAIRTSMTVG